MVKYMEHEVASYYNSHPTEEDLVSESSLHARLVHYLMEALQWLMREQCYSLHENLGFYQTSTSDEKPLAPDIALVKGVLFQTVKSWNIGTTGPAPHVAVEIASEETWDKDLDEKLRSLGIDPNQL